MKVYDIDRETIKAIKDTTLFFLQRFPNQNLDFEIDCGYFLEWVERMKNGPESYMDSTSKAVWEEIKYNERHKNFGSTTKIVKVK